MLREADLHVGMRTPGGSLPLLKRPKMFLCTVSFSEDMHALNAGASRKMVDIHAPAEVQRTQAFPHVSRPTSSPKTVQYIYVVLYGMQTWLYKVE